MKRDIAHKWSMMQWPEFQMHYATQTRAQVQGANIRAFHDPLKNDRGLF